MDYLYIISRMIYLLSNCGNPLLLKIGYTDNISQRRRSYKSHNPNSIFLYIGEGSMENERFLHLFFERYRIGNMNEWYSYNNYIIDYSNNRDINGIDFETMDNSIIDIY